MRCTAFSEVAASTWSTALLHLCIAMQVQHQHRARVQLWDLGLKATHLQTAVYIKEASGEIMHTRWATMRAAVQANGAVVCGWGGHHNLMYAMGVIVCPSLTGAHGSPVMPMAITASVPSTLDA